MPKTTAQDFRFADLPKTEDFLVESAWWRALNSRVVEANKPTLPKYADVVIIGAGLTGVSAGYHLASAGRDTLILDAGTPGKGGSSRNAGFLGRYFKHSFSGMIATKGFDTALRYFSELQTVYATAIDTIESEGLDCGYEKTGRIVSAWTPAHYDAQRQEWDLRNKHLGEAFSLIEPGDASEFGSQIHRHGAVHIVDNAIVHPGKYFSAMHNRCERAGAQIVGKTPVRGISRNGDRFDVRTDRGTIQARDVLVATNGYTTSALPDFNRRLVPIVSFGFETEPLSPNLLKSIIPNQRSYHDTRRTGNFLRVSESGDRLVFGGRTGLHPTPEAAVPSLYREMLDFFPDLEGVRISRLWTGRCATSRSLLPTTGRINGVHFALGYCFSGNAMAPYLGMKVAKRILGDPEAETAFRNDRMGKIPWIARRPEFVRATMMYYRRQDMKDSKSTR